MIKLITRILVILASNPAATQAVPQFPPEDNSIVRLTQLELLYKYDILADDSDAYLDTPDLAAKYGYPVEVHRIITEDGYILTAHRIPYGKVTQRSPARGRPIVWLQHGILASSSDWLYQNKYPPLGFRLADAGYDVWLGNARGNYYSKSHVSLDINSKEYWDFSWHEMGAYDLPACFDYVRSVTGQPDLNYIGHSMGTTMFFVAMAMRPEYNARICLMSALAPVAYTQHLVSPIKYLKPVAPLLEELNMHEFLPYKEILSLLGQPVCHQKSPIQALCENAVFLICGFDSAQMNKTMITVIMGHSPAGTSLKTVVHFAQGVGRDSFNMYDYGKEDNLIHYGQEVPPEYNISQITAPVALYWSENDWLAVPSDVSHLAKQLPNLQRNYRVLYDKFNHLDFVWAVDAPSLLFDTMEEFMGGF